MKKSIIFFISLFVASNLMAQVYFTEAMKFSQTFPVGTARSAGMGGAFGALGGDMYSLSANPAGLGVYRKSEIVITPSYNMKNTTASYFGSKKDEFNNKFNLNNFGYVAAINSKKSTGFVGASFGISYNQLKNFSNNIIIAGVNENSSLADEWWFDADGRDPEVLDPFGSRLAFDAYLIDTVNSDYLINVPLPIRQRKSIETSGSIGELAFSFGTNFSNVLYLGASILINTLQSDETTYHYEYDFQNLDIIDNFMYQNELHTHGRGYGFKLGFIARPVEYIRFGGAFQFPTTYRLSEEYNAYLESNFDDGSYYPVSPTYSDGSLIDIGAFDYTLVTPAKATGSLGFLFGKIGLLSVDAEYINYSKMRLRNGSYGEDFNTDNDVIRDAAGKVLNIRTGGEIRINQVSVRGGFAYFPSPYEDGELNSTANHYDISGGIGIREKNFFIDLGAVYTLHKEKYNLYNDGIRDNIASFDQGNFRILTTIGFRF